jgi:antitoxin YefM
MTAISVNQFRANLKAVVDKAIDDHEPVRISRKNGQNFVVLSEEDYNAEQETLYVLQNENLMKQIAASLKTSKVKKLKKEETRAEFDL